MSVAWFVKIKVSTKDINYYKSGTKFSFIDSFLTTNKQTHFAKDVGDSYEKYIGFEPQGGYIDLGCQDTKA